jgi:cation diffusion facilitator CzcD-associated flavoprotein CzcO
MRRRPLSREEQEAKKGGYAELFKSREATFGGLLFDFMPKSTTSETPEAREAFYSSIWKDGGFKYWVGTYIDNLVDAEANRYSYEFWRKQTQARINDPRKRELLAPEHQPHFLGIKRPSLEVDYYEQFNRPNVDVVDVRNNPIKEFSETGIVMEDGTSHELDVVALATGFVSSFRKGPSDNLFRY